ncbi:Gustatory receptor 34, partial [Frankliniella occidentalis]
MRACSLVSADGVIVLEMPSASRPLARYRQQAAKLPSAFRVVSKKLGGRPRPGRVLALAPPPGMHHLSQFQCWKLDAGRPTTTPVADPVDDELLTTKPAPNSFRAVIGHLIVTGHIIGILPVSCAVDALPLFFWSSPRVVLSLCTATVVLLRIGMYVWSVYRGYMSAFDTLVS